MKNSIDLFSEMMQKSENMQPEPIIVDVSPDAQGMEPELFDGLIGGLQEVIDVNDGLIDESEYTVVEIHTNNTLDNNNQL